MSGYGRGPTARKYDRYRNKKTPYQMEQDRLGRERWKALCLAWAAIGWAAVAQAGGICHWCENSVRFDCYCERDD